MTSSRRPTARIFRSIAFPLCAAVLLAGCDTWFGKGDDPPLPGERISVLAHQRTVNPDPQADPNSIRLPRPLANPDWPQSGGYANHAMHHLELAARPAPAWRADIGRSASDSRPRLAPPIIAAGRVYTMDSEHVVRAFDAGSGQRIWDVDLADDEEDDDVTIGGIAFEDGRIVATTGFAKIIALDAATGEELWREKKSAPFHSPPTVRAGRVFAVSIDNTLYALGVHDGGELWKHTAIVETANLLGGAAPAVDSGVVVAPFSSGELVALKVETGQELWSDSLTSARRTDELGALSQIRAAPVIDRGLVFAVSHGDLMAAIDLRTGRRVWDKDLGGLQTPWVAGNYLFMITNENEVVALGREDGRIYWVTPLPAYENPEELEDPILWSGPVLAGDRLIIAGSNGDAMTLSPYTGKVLGIQAMSDPVSVTPIVANRALFLLSDDSELISLR